MKPYYFNIMQIDEFGFIDDREIFVLATNEDEALSFVKADYKNLFCVTPIRDI